MKHSTLYSIYIIFIPAIIAQSTFTSTSGSSGTIVVSNPPNNLLSLVNNTFGTAGVFDPFSNLTSLFNGQNGSAVFYNYHNNTGIYIPGGTSNYTWNSSVETWPEYIINTPINQTLNTSTNTGTAFTSANVSLDIMDEIASMLSNLSLNYSHQLQATRNISLNLLSNISNDIADPLSNLLPLFETHIIPVYFDLSQLISYLHGMHHFCNLIKGGTNFLRNYGVIIDPGLVYYSKNGIDALASLLFNLDCYIDLDDVLDPSLNSEEGLFELISELGGINCTTFTYMFGPLIAQYYCNTTDTNIGGASSYSNDVMESVSSLYNVTETLGPGFNGMRNILSRLIEQAES